MLTNKTIGFIGAGNMGEAIIRGLLKSKKVAPAQIIASDRIKERISYIAEHYGVKIFSQNLEIVKGADIVILTVKPNDVKTVLQEIGSELSKDKLFISAAGGLAMENILQYIPHSVQLIRAMPNTPALVMEGITGLCLGYGISEENKKTAAAIFEAIGKVVFIEKEELMDAVTGLSGSGPAYAFLILEALSDAGVMAGLPRNTANILAIQTLLGSAKLAMESGKHFGALKDMVTSPGGTTIAGLAKLEEAGVRSALIKAVAAATERSKELAGS